ncbi:MAG: hypothetical protein FJ190_10725 [Gammaproteobacteria bacterium]|nr:hypothetical protein [Gammaproteobacteria bacterium]
MLIGCAGTSEPRHQDLSGLEKPPGHDSNNKSAEISKATETKQAEASDTSGNKGLFSDVYQIEGKDTKIKIKRNMDEAWVLVGKAVLLNELKIIGKNRKEGRYQVA